MARHAGDLVAVAAGTARVGHGPRTRLVVAAPPSGKPSRLTRGHGYYAAVKDRQGGKRAALSQAREIICRACHMLAELGDDALATV